MSWRNGCQCGRLSFEGWALYDDIEAAECEDPDAVEVVFYLDNRPIGRQRMDFDEWDALCEQWKQPA